MIKLTSEQSQVAREIAELADEGGTIQALDMVALTNRGILPNDPTLHTTSSLGRAWIAAGLPENTAELLWG